MTRIDFYILPEQGSVLSTAVKLCDKASASGKQVFVSCKEGSQLDALDDLLWTQRQGSFIAHERHIGRPLSAPSPMVLIGAEPPPADWQDVLLNLSGEVPAFFSRFDRLCEIVGADEESRAQSRQRFKFYRERGYEIKTLEQQVDGSWLARQ